MSDLKMTSVYKRSPAKGHLFIKEDHKRKLGKGLLSIKGIRKAFCL